jgi:tetratricopeptide (TPR) repeat protein
LTVVLIVGIVAVLFFLVRYFVDTDRAPRTELERAVFAAEEAVRAQPDSAASRIKLASAYLEADAIGSAREQADIAVRLAPADPAAYYILGLVQMKQGDTKSAIDSYTKATSLEGQLAPFYQDVWAAAAKAYLADGQSDKALEAINKSLDFGPENALLLVERARVYEDQGLWADALYDYYQALSFGYEEAMEDIDRITEDHPEALTEVQERFGVGPDGSLETTSPH